MADLSPHIIHLLRKFGSFRLADFGRFIVSVEPMSVHPTLHEFKPERKTVSFTQIDPEHENQQLHSLAELLKQVYSKPLSETSAIETAFVAQLQNDLNDSGSAKIEGVGSFKSGPAGIVWFTAQDGLNLSDRHFGLQPITAKPVIREKKITQVEETDTRKAVALPKPQAVGTKNTAKKQSKKTLWWLLAAILFIVPAIALVTDSFIPAFKLSDFSVQQKLEQLFGKTIEPEEPGLPVHNLDHLAVQTPPEQEYLPFKEIESSDSESAESVETNDHSSIQEEEVANSTESTTEELPEQVNSAAAQIEQSEERTIEAITGYYMIVSSHASEREASAKRNQLNALNSACVVAKGRNGRYRVGVFAHRNKNQAMQVLAEFKEEFNDAWLLKIPKSQIITKD